MAKDPAFLFYPGDWLGGTMTFSRSHKGAYMDLLMAQFNQGHMDLQDVQTILANDFDSMWESKLKNKFKQDPEGRFYNEKLEEEIVRRKKFTKSRRDNLSGMSPHMGDRMETETVNEIETIISYLNKCAEKSFRSDTDKTQKFIRARLSEGRTLEDFFTVINNKVAEWKDNDMNQYLRPETLFGNKFESYLNAKPVKKLPDDRFKHNLSAVDQAKEELRQMDENEAARAS